MGNVYKVLSEIKIKPSPSSFPTRLVIELCECIHLHYRNIRVDFDDLEFLRFAYTIGQAAGNLSKHKMEKLERKTLSIDVIDPWDSGHIKIDDGFIAGSNTQEHRDKIDFIKSLIQRGRKITPILVRSLENGMYHRKNGFCRYMAFYELGYKEIECFINKDAVPIEQYNIPLLEE